MKTKASELDALVAEKIMDDPVDRQIVDQHGFEIILCRSRQVLPRYSTDIAAAWTVVEKLGEDGFLLYRVSNRPIWRAQFNLAEAVFDWPGYADAETAPLAICRAALSAVARRAALKILEKTT